ncbi:MAG: ABC transporter ATP-binding protein [Calditrichaeota bacterium]|nr:MAG: ABC transporter ATP-binding protein [Calditrichota bacterium]MBL1206163.1 ABC transporter ATP-binding protein [Calditrichota bacterium]NOG45988.1 ABC transporter ATP-binding protein [Calditrichota bacterium]
MDPLVIKSVSKQYGAIEALSDVSFSVKKGEIFGLIGPDGAGKTTLLRMIVSLLNPDRGEVLFQGRQTTKDIAYIRSNAGYMPQRFSLYQDLTVEENLKFFGDLFRVPEETQLERIANLYEFSRLGPFKDRPAGNLSGGMKQKLALSCMLIHEPEIMVLDEPTFGVDPISRIEFWEILYKLRENGATLIVSTPYMDEALRCNRTAMIYDGKIMVNDRPQNIIDNFQHNLFVIESESPHKLYNELLKNFDEQNLQLFSNGIHIIDRANAGEEKLKKQILQNVAGVKNIQKSQPGLENIFLDLMQTTGGSHE